MTPEERRQCDQYHCGHEFCNKARAAELNCFTRADGECVGKNCIHDAELLTDTKPDGD